MTISGRSLASALIMLLSPLVALALDRDVNVDHLHHTAWTQADGLMGQVNEIAQTTDGYLWVNTDRALYRFDGKTFEPVNATVREPIGEPPIASIIAICADRNSGLWIAHRNGDIDHINGTQVKTYSNPMDESGHPRIKNVQRLAQDAEGTVWLTTLVGLFRLESGEFKAVGTDQGYVGGPARNLYVDHAGAVWIMAANGALYRHGNKADPFDRYPLGSAHGETWIAESPNGDMWAANADGLFKVPSLIGSHGETPKPWIDAGSKGPLFSVATIDRDGGLWLADAHGITRIAYPESITPSDTTRSRPVPSYLDTPKAGLLTSDEIKCVLEDREGNIWVGTSGGLDQFRNNDFVSADLPPFRQIMFTVAAGPEGTVWTSTWLSALMKVDGHGKLASSTDAKPIVSLRSGHDGSLWIGGGEGRILHATADIVSPVSPALKNDDTVIATAVDSKGSLWAATSTPEVYRLENGIWSAQAKKLALPPRFTYGMTADESGRIWLPYDNTLIVVDGETVHRYSEAEGLLPGYSRTMTARGRHIWLGGLAGVTLFDNRKFRVLRGIGGETFSGVTGIVETSKGELWLNDFAGGTRIAADELEKAIADTSYLVRFDQFDSLNGLNGQSWSVYSTPTAIESSDGKVWFSTIRGIFYVDPEKVAKARNTVPPSVFITGLSVDGKRSLPFPESIQLPALSQNVTLNYTALALTVPERTHFKYQLEGFDSGWQDAGVRRQAFYTKLPPGTYTFHVIASTNEGLWNNEGSRFTFTVAPAYSQTLWFEAVCGLAILLALGGLYLLRMRQIARQIHGRMEERLFERERIARDLHDTLLQGFQSVTLRLQAVASQLPNDDPTRGDMERALDQADSVIAEGRDRVQDLRASTQALDDLPELLGDAGAILAKPNSVAFELVLEGTRRALSAIVRDEAYQIGREAIVNALNHARARTIRVTIIFNRNEFCLRICDDGVGIASDILEAGGRPGHWGITGMKERASKVDSILNLRSRFAAGQGTEVELKVRAALAYPVDRRKSWFPRITDFLTS